MKPKSLTKWVWMLLLFLPSMKVFADFMPSVPTDYDQVKVSLVTVGRGSQLHARMGHSIIRIQDFSNKMDYLANWGMFDFQDPLFLPKFFKGVLMYRMAFSPYRQTIAYYRYMERRSIKEDELSLTSKQKQALVTKIIWNAQPENISYPYQYFRNNCATIPRDFLDVALRGGIRLQLGDEIQLETYRQYVWRNLASNLLVGWGLDVIFNGDTDTRLTKFEEMFYPIKFRENLLNINQVDDDGLPIDGSPLISETHILVDLPEPADAIVDGYQMTAFLTGIPLILVLMGIVGQTERSPSLFRLRHRIFGLVSIWWGLTAGFFGLTHFFSWLFSSHTDLHHNLNILFLWPVEFLVLIPGLLLGLRKRDFNVSGFLKIGFWQRFAQIHIISNLTYVIFAYSGLTNQNVWRPMIYMLPLSLLYYYVMLLLVRERR